MDHNHHHVDESEEFKKASFLAAKNRKRLAKITYVLLVLLALAVAAALFFAYFIDK